MMTKPKQVKDYDYSQTNIISKYDDLHRYSYDRTKIFGLTFNNAKNYLKNLDKNLVSCLDILNQKITPSFSLTSKKYSIWSQFDLLLSQHINIVIEEIGDQAARKLLENFQLGKLGLESPVCYFDYSKWLLQANDNEPYGNYIYGTDKFIHKTHTTRYLKITSNLDLWEKNIRFSIRSIKQNTPDDSNVNNRILDTLELVRLLIETLKSYQLAPKFMKHESYDFKNHQQAKKFNLDTHYCELCWRLTMRSNAIKNHPKVQIKKYAELEQNGIAALKRNHDPIPMKILGLSNRFCDYHNPSDNKSMYRADIRYKKAFMREVTALQSPITEPSPLFIKFAFMSGYEQDLRKAAYDLVHSKLYLNLHSANEKNIKKSLTAQVFELKIQGLKQSDIARKLGKSRQEISRAYKKINTIQKTRLNEDKVHEDTGETFTLLEFLRPDNDRKLLKQVHDLKNAGMSTLEIAKKVNRYRYSVIAMLQHT